jgi:thioredoxin 1
VIVASELRDVTDDTFDEEVLRSEKTVVVDFWAEWCGPCRLIAPILHEIATEYGDKLDIVRLNIDENPHTSRTYRVMSIPMLNVYRDGRVEKTIIGAQPKSALEAELNEFIS